MLQCSYCAKKFKYESERKRHEQSHFPQFECQVCYKKFSFLSALRRHQKQHERNGTVQCNDCGRNFRDNSLLLRHIKYAHKGTHVCTKCNAKFNSDLALSSHMKTHKPKSQRKFHCSHDGCTKSFNFVHHLKHHELTHTNTKQYHCSICGKGFIQAHHLKSHLKTHEPENWLQCNVFNCKKSFATEYALKRHLTTHRTIIDSGISSDSSNDVHHDSIQDSQVCSTCGQLVANTSYEHHKASCDSDQHEKFENFNTENVCDINRTYIKAETELLELSRWAVNEKSSRFEIRNNAFDGLPNINNNILNIESTMKPVASNKGVNNACESCTCCNIDNKESNVCDKPIVTKSSIFKLDSNVPKIKYKSDGTIKIEETFDLEISKMFRPRISKSIEESNNLLNFVPFNSCKDVLGRCIVSGSGTISDECLCAKMAIDDHQMIEQEIDEITPKPVHN